MYEKSLKLNIRDIVDLKEGNKTIDEFYLEKTYSHLPHLGSLPYDRRSNDPDELQERLDAIDERLEEEYTTINKLKKEIKQNKKDLKEATSKKEQAQKQYIEKEKTAEENKERYEKTQQRLKKDGEKALDLKEKAVQRLRELGVPEPETYIPYLRYLTKDNLDLLLSVDIDDENNRYNNAGEEIRHRFLESKMYSPTDNVRGNVSTFFYRLGEEIDWSRTYRKKSNDSECQSYLQPLENILYSMGRADKPYIHFPRSDDGTYGFSDLTNYGSDYGYAKRDMESLSKDIQKLEKTEASATENLKTSEKQLEQAQKRKQDYLGEMKRTSDKKKEVSKKD